VLYSHNTWYQNREQVKGSANIPFIISGSPKSGFKSGVRIEQPVCLEDDPREERDLSKEDSHAETLKTWRIRLVKRLDNRPEGFSKNGTLIPGRPYEPSNRGTILH
jgi:hypothetical protein